MRFSKIVLGIITLSMLVTIPVLAATVKVGETVSLSAPVEDDVYIAGGQVTVSEAVSEDLLAAGGSLVINSTVGQDLLVIGGSLNINAEVADDLRAAGGDITITKNIGDDVLVGGGNIIIPEGVIISGDATIAGGAVIFGGTIEGDAKIVAGEITFNGIINGDADIRADVIDFNGTINGKSTLAAGRLSLQDDARFGNNITYWTSTGKIDFTRALATGTAEFDSALKFKKGDYEAKASKFFSKLAGGLIVLSILSAALILLLLVVLTKNFFDTSAKRLDEQFWKHFGIGLLYFIAMPVLIILLFFTLIGIPLALMAIPIYLISLYLAKIITALLLAKWFELRNKRSLTKVGLYFLSLLIFIIMKLMLLVPVIGWIAILVFTFAGFGAFITTKYEVFQKIR